MNDRRDASTLHDAAREASVLPMGSRAAPVRRWRRRRTPGVVRAVGHVMALAVGLGMALAGGALAWTASRPVSVSLDSNAYRIGEAVLHRLAPGVYGGAGSVVIRHVDGVIHAAGAGQLNGESAVGVCVEASGGRVEDCTFVLTGSRRVACTDRFGLHGWDRTCGQSAVTHIDATAPIPVPFPVGL